MASVADSPQEIRDKLFKCHLLNDAQDEKNHLILKSICIRNGKIPHLAISSVPNVNSYIKEDRELFIKLIVSTTNLVNKIIMEQRAFLRYVKNKKSTLSPNEQEKFRMICAFYQSKDIGALLEKVVPIPVSLSVAQASLESQYGSIQNIRSKNAYYGLAQSGNRLFSFDALYKSVIAYAKTLNVNPAYKVFRQKRMEMISRGEPVNGQTLSTFITKKYGTDKNYQNLVNQLMQENDLRRFDQIYRYS